MKKKLPQTLFALFHFRILLEVVRLLRIDGQEIE